MYISSRGNEKSSPKLSVSGNTVPYLSVHLLHQFRVVADEVISVVVTGGGVNIDGGQEHST